MLWDVKHHKEIVLKQKGQIHLIPMNATDEELGQFVDLILQGESEEEMKDGRIVHGEVVSETIEEVSFKEPIGTYSYAKSQYRKTQIERIERTAAAPTPPSSQSAVPPSAPVAEASLLVMKVVDGDTLKLSDGQTVRLIGVDTPETVHPTKPVQYFGKEASAFTKRLAEGKTVTWSTSAEDRQIRADARLRVSARQADAQRGDYQAGVRLRVCEVPLSTHGEVSEL